MAASSSSQVSSTNMDDWKVEDFETVCLAGLGAFSTVHEVIHPSTGETRYALKAVSKEKIKTTKNMEHLFGEKDALATLESPFTVKFHRTFQDDTTLYFLMEHLPLNDLGEALLRMKKFSLPQAQYYASCAVLALEYIHSKGYIFRDLKLKNLSLDSGGTPKIIDYGFTKKLAAGDRTSSYVGSPAMLAPEMVGEGPDDTKRSYDHAVDWWSLGVVVYEMVQGRTPFLGDSMEDTMNNIKTAEPVFADELWTHDARDFVTQLLVKDPAKRLGTKGGASEVKAHAWFHQTPTWWSDVANKKVDTSGFDLGIQPLSEGGSDPFDDF